RVRPQHAEAAGTHAAEAPHPNRSLPAKYSWLPELRHPRRPPSRPGELQPPLPARPHSAQRHVGLQELLQIANIELGDFVIATDPETGDWGYPFNRSSL